MTVNPDLPVSVSIAADANPVCDGTLVTFTATPVNEGTTPSYQWYVGANPVGSDSPTFSTSTLNDGDVVTVELTSDATCATGNPATSNAVTMTVNPDLPVSVSIAADANPVCDGTSVTFTATPTNGGTTPSYQWYVDGSPVGTSSDTYNYIPSNGDVVTVELTSDATCASGNPATSNPVTMTVDPILPVSVSIAANANPVCAGTPVTYTATPTNEGTTPVYQWYVNSTPVGTNSNTYNYTPAEGDVVSVDLTSNANCVTDNPASSNQITMNVDVAAPSTPATPTGDVSVCSAATLLNYTVTAVANATSYIWNLPSGWTIVSGNGTNSISVDMGSASSGNYNISVSASNACGTSSASSNLSVSVGDYATADAGPDQTICYLTSIIDIDGIAGGAANSAKGTWATSGTGTIGNGNPNTNKPSTTYNPSAADRAAGTVTLTFTTEDPKGSCGPESDQLILTIRPDLFATISGDATICEGSSSTITFTSNPNTVITYNDGTTDQTITVGGTGTETLDSGPLTATTTYTLVSVDWATVPSCSKTVTATATVTVNPAATADAGIPQTVCADGTVTLNGSVGGGATSGIWSTSGDGAFDDNSLLAAVYTPGASDISNGTVILTLTTDDPTGPCGPVSSTTTITISPAPTVDAGANQTICEGSSATLAGSVGGSASSGTWTGGAGTFNPDNTTLTATYTPSAAEITAGSVTLTLTTDDPAGTCGPVSATTTITIDPVPTVDAGSPQTICSDGDVNLSGSIGGSASSATWSGYAGTISDPNDLNAVYTPSASEIAAGSVTLTLTTDDPTGPCGPGSSTTTITISPTPTVDAGTNQTICEGSSATLSGTVGGSASSGTWTGGTGTFSPNNTTLTATYTPSATEITAGTVTLTLTTDDPAGACDPVSASTTITIDPAPTVDAGADQTICQGSSAVLSGTVGGGANASWTGGAGAFNPDRNTASATYTPTGAEVAAGTVTLTLTATDPAGLCDPCKCNNHDHNQ